MSEIKNITILGAGMMGPGLAQIFAVKGYNVTLWARRAEVLPGVIETIKSNLKLMAEYGIGKAEDIDSIVSRVKTTDNFEEAVKDADFVEEAIGEKLELKQEFFQKLDKLCKPETILATNTSVISITEIASKSENRHRMIGTHFWNPPYLIPLVEVVPTPDTSDETIQATMELLEGCGRKPIHVKKDVPGFVANRLQHALWREAISIVERGIADPKTVDDAIRYSFGFRLPILAPIENSDMVGTQLTWNIHSYILKHIENSTEPSPILKEMLDSGKMGFPSGSGFYEWTDEKIAKSKRALQEYLIKQQGTNDKDYL